ETANRVPKRCANRHDMKGSANKLRAALPTDDAATPYTRRDITIRTTEQMDRRRRRLLSMATMGIVDAYRTSAPDSGGDDTPSSIRLTNTAAISETPND